MAEKWRKGTEMQRKRRLIRIRIKGERRLMWKKMERNG